MPGRASSSPATAPATPAATQRSCCRSTPREARNRSTTQTAAAGRLAQCNSTPMPLSTAAIVPAQPASPNGLSIGVDSSRPGVRLPTTTAKVAPATLVATTTRQRREPSRPSGSRRAGRVTPSAIAGAQP
jgi:hypothetical protein